jgi:hypothetical protein
MNLDSDLEFIMADAQPSSSVVRETERRLHARYTVRVQIEIHQEGSEVPLCLETTDLSRGGCYVQMMIPLATGIRLRGMMWLDGCPAAFRGLVVTRHPQFGNGIMFVEFEGEGERVLKRYLDAMVG